MRAFQIVSSILFTAVWSGLAAAGSGTPMGAMSDCEVIAVMPDGQMAKANITDAAKMNRLKKIAKPIPWCMMFMRDADGKVYMIDTSSHSPMVECENMVQ